MDITPGNIVAGHNQALGAFGESLAESYLVDRGMRVLERNWRCRHGELDLVMADGDTAVAVEVKTRSGPALGTPFNAITAHKVARLRLLLYEWSRARRLGFAQLRIDAVAVLLQRNSVQPQIDYLRGIS